MSKTRKQLEDIWEEVHELGMPSGELVDEWAKVVNFALAQTEALITRQVQEAEVRLLAIIGDDEQLKGQSEYDKKISEYDKKIYGFASADAMPNLWLVRQGTRNLMRAELRAALTHLSRYTN